MRQAIKTITAIFQTIGKRKKLVGFEAKYNGHLVGTYDNRERARFELDQYAYAEARAA